MPQVTRDVSTRSVSLPFTDAPAPLGLTVQGGGGRRGVYLEGFDRQQRPVAITQADTATLTQAGGQNPPTVFITVGNEPQRQATREEIREIIAATQRHIEATVGQDRSNYIESVPGLLAQALAPSTLGLTLEGGGGRRGVYLTGQDRLGRAVEITQADLSTLTQNGTYNPSTVSITIGNERPRPANANEVKEAIEATLVLIARTQGQDRSNYIESVPGLLQTELDKLVGRSQPQVVDARFGTFYQPDGKVAGEGLLLQLQNVQAFASLELRNRTQDPLGSSSYRALPANTALADPADGGTLSVFISKADAALLGLNPGDTIELRQVPVGGRPSDEVTVRLDQKSRTLGTTRIDGPVDSFAQGQVPPPGDQYSVYPATDSWGPKIELSAMNVHRVEGRGLLISGLAGPDVAEVRARKDLPTTSEVTASTPNDQGLFSLDLPGGHPIYELTFVDHNGMATVKKMQVEERAGEPPTLAELWT